jgi:hypothetical protein
MHEKDEPMAARKESFRLMLAGNLFLQTYGKNGAFYFILFKRDREDLFANFKNPLNSPLRREDI